MRTTAHRCLWTALLFAAALRPNVASGQTLKPRLDGETLHWSAADLRFLSAEALQQLHDGATVSYSFQVNVSATRNGTVLKSLSYHCVFSYDIWEKRFKVSRVEPGFRAASHLTEMAAQDMCLDSLTIPLSSLSADTPFWVGIDYSMEDRKSSTSQDSKSILGTFVEVFSQRKGKPQSTGTLQGGPFRVSELRKTH